MDPKMDIAVIEECTRLAFEDNMTFPETVGKLNAIGVERYHADLGRLQKTYYSVSNEVVELPLPLSQPPAIGKEFSEGDVVGALRAIQSGKIGYGEFLRRIMKGGAVAYDVFLSGRKAIYTGRKGEFYVENFPENK